MAARDKQLLTAEEYSKQLANRELFPPVKQQEIQEEEQHFQTVLQSFRKYKEHSLAVIHGRLRPQWECVDERHRQMLPDYDTYFDEMLECVTLNDIFLQKIVEPHQLFTNPSQAPYDMQAPVNFQPLEGDIDKVRSTLRQFVRDWSVEGGPERALCYDPIIEEINNYFGQYTNKTAIRVLVPGCGLSRLAFEIQKQGYSCQGNEFSFHMLLASDYILNRCKGAETICPFVHQTTNVFRRKDVVRAVSIPDAFPGNYPTKPGQDFSMVAGDFLEVYANDQNKDQWHVVVTCFFLDTAHNVFDYIETIHHCLCNGGVWINLGPLLYHFSDMRNELSVELSLEDIRNIIPKFGFDLRRDEIRQCPYTTNPKSMLQVTYSNAFFTAVKSSRPATWRAHRSPQATPADAAAGAHRPAPAAVPPLTIPSPH